VSIKSAGWGEGIEKEFEGARLGDARLVARAKRMARALSLRPDVGFPKAFESESQLEAFYRFVNNDRVSPEGVLYGHVEETLQRSAAARLCLLVHDSSEFNYTSEREGLGRTGTSAAGFTGHFCLAVTADGARTPLGMLALRTHARTGKKPPKRTSHARRSDAGRESQRWYEQLKATEQLRGDQFDAVHVMDRPKTGRSSTSPSGASRRRWPRCRQWARARSSSRLGLFRLPRARRSAIRRAAAAWRSFR
jgi:Transposase DNA-binding